MNNRMVKICHRPYQRNSHVTQKVGLLVLSTLTILSGCAASRHGARPSDVTWKYDEGGIVRGDITSKKIALIFTGGEHGEGSGTILDALQQADIKAAFFVTGDYLAVAQHQPYLRRMIADGHYLGPHSHAHPLYCAWEDRWKTLVTEQFFKRDLERNISELRHYGALREPGAIYFIPPYEWFNAEQVTWAKSLGMILFNFTPGSGSNRDWIPEGHPGFVSSDTILQDILKYEQHDPYGLNGFLLLLHLGSQRIDKMHKLLPELIEELSQRGYEFVRIDRMLPDAYSPSMGKH